MKLNFYIIYSIYIPINLEEDYDNYYDMSIRELIEALKEASIELPFDEYEENGDEDEDVNLEEELSFAEYKETDKFFDEYYGEFQEEMIELLVNQNKTEEEINKILKNNI